MLADRALDPDYVVALRAFLAPVPFPLIVFLLFFPVPAVEFSSEINNIAGNSGNPQKDD